MFPDPQFLHTFREKSAAGAAIHWTAARPYSWNPTEKTQGFGNMLIKVIVKTHGSASEQCPNPVFSHVFIPLDWLSHNPKKKHMKVPSFNEKTTKLPKNDEKRNVKIQGSGKIMENHSFKTPYFTRYSATRCLAHSQNTINEQNWDMLAPKNNFSCEASIPGVPALRLHPAP
jgi:hypothetical protein